MYQVIYKTKAIKQLKKIQREQATQIREKCRRLSTFPNCQNIKSLTNHPYQYRLRVGNYRVFFNTGADGEVYVIHIEEVKKRDENTY